MILSESGSGQVLPVRGNGLGGLLRLPVPPGCHTCLRPQRFTEAAIGKGPRFRRYNATMVRKLLICVVLAFAWGEAGAGKVLEGETSARLNAILKQVIDNQMENDRARYSYVYEEKAVVDRYSTTGNIEESVSRTYTWVHTELESFSKLTSINGARYDRQYLQAQDRAIQRSISDAERLSPRKRKARIARTRRERDGQMQTEIFRNLLAAFRFTLTGREHVNGWETLVLDFEPRAGFEPPSSRAAFLRSLSGKLWITRESHQPIRLTGRLGEDVRFVGGLFGSLKKGATITLEQADIGNGLWLPTFTTVTYRRSLLFKGAHRRETSLFRDYRLNPGSRPTDQVQVESLD